MSVDTLPGGTSAPRDPGLAKQRSSVDLDAVIVGAVDTHCHSGPSVMPRDLDHVEATREAIAAGMRAIVLKDHYYSAAPITPLLNKHHGAPGFEAIGGIALNNAVGGLNPYAVEHALKIGGRIIWMPTFSAANHIDQQHSPTNPAGKSHWSADDSLEPLALRALDADGVLKPELDAILSMIANTDAVLCGGHLHISEIWAVFHRAKELGVKRFLVNHPTFLVGASDQDMIELAAFGAYLEHSICMFDPAAYAAFSPEALKRLIDLVGVEHTILGSDLGQKNNPHPVDGFRHVAKLCFDLGYSAADIRQMIVHNPSTLLGLSS